MRKTGFMIIPLVLLSMVLLLGGCGRKGSDTGSDPDQGQYTSLEQLNGKKIGIQTGTFFDQECQKYLKDPELLYYSTYTDLLMALESGKIDGFPMDEEAVRLSMRNNPKITIIDSDMDTFDFGYIFAKTPEGETLRAQFDEYLAKIKEDGTLDELSDMWFDSGEDEWVVPDYESLPPTNGTLVFATEGEYSPFNFVKDGKLCGFEIDMVTRFCREYGYGIEFECMSFGSLIATVQSGKCDFGGSAMTITAERSEEVSFSQSYFHGRTVMAVLKADEGEDASFFDSVKESFNKTFIREKRYSMFLDGIVETLIITVLSVIFGTVLGFVVYLWCRSGRPFPNMISDFFIWLIQGMPMVVLLMILYYIIFGNVGIDGIWVSVIGFTLTFGSSVFGMLRSGVGAVDKGQTEAAYALGLTDRETFFGIVLPQAAQFFMPSFKAEIVSLIKATSIVGYIAVQDLTKMGDIVRSRTYEAFFPLIAVAVIYFILAWILTTIIKGLTFGIDPRKRSREQILKGVKTHD